MTHEQQPNFRRREECKEATVLPVVSDLGPKITMPHKTTRPAARAVASSDRFWDKRKAQPWNAKR